MRKFDYSFLDNGLLPSNLINLTSVIYSLKTGAEIRKDENEKIYLTFSIEKNSISRYNTKCKIELEKRCIRRR
jgi:hypothetical protein